MSHPADHLNRDCTCISLDRVALCRAFEAIVGDAEFCRRLRETHPTLISSQPLFLAAAHVRRMAEIIDTIERVARHPDYVAAAIDDAEDKIVARYAPGAAGVLMGYDFHLAPGGPKLIEINTNAGGGLINALVSRAQRACCAEAAAFDPVAGETFEARVVASFREDWRRQMGTRPLARIAIVDVAPETQYLYPEFILFERLLASHGIEAVISPPEALARREGALWLDGERIDLVYNRLTDFRLAEPGHSALREAYLAGEVVVTPNPRAHAMLADKRNLIRLTDPATLGAWGIPGQDIATLLAGIPRTVLVTPQRADALWSARSGLFFKPVSGFASRAAYRGDKVTRKVWEQISSGGYVAQDLVPPSARTIVVDGARQVMKVDVRNYCYDGKVQLVAARLYQGQTTNFRTPGGGFAPVLCEPLSPWSGAASGQVALPATGSASATGVATDDRGTR